MSNLTSSIVRGFGFTIGKRAANSMLDNRNVSNGSTKHSTFTVWFGTFLFGSFLGAIIGLVLYGMTKLDVMVFVGLVVGYFLMYKYYISQNKKYDTKMAEMTRHKQEAEKIIKNIQQQYINEEITKREYEILMKDANQLLTKIQNELV